MLYYSVEELAVSYTHGVNCNVMLCLMCILHVHVRPSSFLQGTYHPVVAVTHGYHVC